MNLEAYLKTLAFVMTELMPVGALFYARPAIYEVLEVDPRGHYSRARQWRGGENTEVALVQGSTLAKRLPLVEQGYLLPPIPSREDLLLAGHFQAFVFPNEQNALDAAYLDAALCGKSSGLYPRRYDRYPAFELTNGMFVGRRYYFSQTNEGLETKLADLKTRLKQDFTPHSEGPIYWRLLSSWTEAPYYDMTQTIPFLAIDLDQMRENIPAYLEDTLYRMKAVKPDAKPEDENKEG